MYCDRGVASILKKRVSRWDNFFQHHLSKIDSSNNDVSAVTSVSISSGAEAADLLPLETFETNVEYTAAEQKFDLVTNALKICFELDDDSDSCSTSDISEGISPEVHEYSEDEESLGDEESPNNEEEDYRLNLCDVKRCQENGKYSYVCESGRNDEESNADEKILQYVENNGFRQPKDFFTGENSKDSLLTGLSKHTITDLSNNQNMLSGRKSRFSLLPIAAWHKGNSVKGVKNSSLNMCDDFNSKISSESFVRQQTCISNSVKNSSLNMCDDFNSKISSESFVRQQTCISNSVKNSSLNMCDDFNSKISSESFVRQQTCISNNVKSSLSPMQGFSPRRFSLNPLKLHGSL